MAIVAIQPYGGPNDRQWFWNVSDSVHAPYCQQDPDPPSAYIPQTFDVAFVLYGDAGATCYANCDNSTAAPDPQRQRLHVLPQQLCRGRSVANCDNSTSLRS